MNTLVKKWGNSLGIRIPSTMARDLEIEDGSAVEIFEEKDRIVILPSRKKRLPDLLDGITPENLHSEVSWGKAKGREAW